MGHDDVVSGYSISTGFRRLMGCQRDPRDRGITVGELCNNNFCLVYFQSINGNLMSQDNTLCPNLELDFCLDTSEVLFLNFPHNAQN